jgi:hypothetical protein
MPRKRSSRKYRGFMLSAAKSAAAKLSARANEKGPKTLAILQQRGKEAAKKAADFATDRQIKTSISFLEHYGYQVTAPA